MTELQAKEISDLLKVKSDIAEDLSKLINPNSKIGIGEMTSSFYMIPFSFSFNNKEINNKIKNKVIDLLKIELKTIEEKLEKIQIC